MEFKLIGVHDYLPPYGKNVLVLDNNGSFSTATRMSGACGDCWLATTAGDPCYEVSWIDGIAAIDLDVVAWFDPNQETDVSEK